ncbi:hypothetical protein K501DRAFT_282798, partial [Backusella circina FSU 941]
MEIVFDNEERPSYFGGDTVQGKVFITSNQSNYNLNMHFRFAWTGTVQVQPIESNKDSRVLFSQLYKISREKLYKTVAKTEKGTMPLYFTELVQHQQLDEGNETIILQKKKTIAITFNVKVPNDRVLPSSTQTNNSSNKIIYLLEAFIHENNHKRPQFVSQRLVPVYEKIYTQPLMKEQKNEQSYQINTANKGALRVTLPCLGCQAGMTIPVSVSIWNNQEITRKQAIAVSLIRINHVYANDRVYMSQPEKVHRVVTDLNLVNRGDAMCVQKIYIGLPIPKHVLPTITLESSQLISVSYLVRVQVYAQRGIYQPIGAQSDDLLEFMVVDLPFTIGTIQNSPIATPLLPPSPSSASVAAQSFTDMSFSSTSTSNDDMQTDEEKKTGATHKIKKTSKLTRNILKAGIFRKSSSNSGSSLSIANVLGVEEEEKNVDDKKTNSNVTFELYEQQPLENDTIEQKDDADIAMVEQIEQLTIKDKIKPD